MDFLTTTLLVWGGHLEVRPMSFWEGMILILVLCWYIETSSRPEATSFTHGPEIGVNGTQPN